MKTLTQLREKIADILRTKRPNLTASSCKTYCSSLVNLAKQIKGNDETIGVDWFSQNEKEILEFLEKKEPKLRKGTLSALFVLTDIETYREQMLKDCKLVNENNKEQKKSDKEALNWVTQDMIKEKYTQFKQQVDDMIESKLIHHNTFINFFLVALLGGVLMPPRRSLDYAEMKVRNFDEDKDNYIKNGTMVFNIYKTAKKYGKQIVKIPKELVPYIKKWTKYQKNDYLLFANNDKPLNSSQITKLLNTIFGKKVSVDILRHVYLSNYYKDIPNLKDMVKIAADMGHSISQALEYVKKD